MKSQPRAFTLIELLVVIAIIAILAAILFPVFAQAKMQAKKASVISDHKQISLAMLMYTNDADDMFPQGESGDNFGANKNVTHVTWSTIIYPYVKNGDQDVDPTNGNHFVCVAKGGLFNDPAGPQIDQNNYAHEGYYYGPNRLICPANYQSGETWFGGQLVVPLTTTYLPTPADTVLLSEKGMNVQGPWNYPWIHDEQTFYIHTGIANIPGNPGAGVKTDGNTVMTPGTLGYDPIVDTDCSGSSSGLYDCGATPRYRYNNTSVFAYADGHAKSVSRGALMWFKNIYVQRSDIPSTNWVYGYYPSEPF
jgi:prepilin-type N-terminal cleavage/methylation domain-containing protein